MKKTLKDRLAIAAIATVLSTVVLQLMFPDDGLLANFGMSITVAVLYQGLGVLIEYLTQKYNW